MDFQLDRHCRFVPGGPVKRTAFFDYPLLYAQERRRTKRKKKKGQLENKTRISVAESGHAVMDDN